jgi:hypothetical protein
LEFLLDTLPVFGFASVLENQDLVTTLNQQSNGIGSAPRAPEDLEAILKQLLGFGLKRVCPWL